MLIFNSKVEKPEYLEKLLVGRKSTTDALEKSILNSAKHKQNIQYLIIGNRGSGKTHLIRVLFNRISGNKSIANNFCVAYMAEEEIGIDSFFALLIRIIEAFIRWSDDLIEKKEWERKIDLLKETNPLEREERAKKYILSFLGDKRLLILIENINEIFEGMKPNGQARLRDFIQQTNKVSIIATSQSLFTDIQREDKPFHNFFQIIQLNRLTNDETKELIYTLSNIEASNELKNHLKTSKGEGQIRAIHFLSEGNHRLIALFFEFLKTDIKSNLSEPFLKTLDKLKPYYESFIRYLPPQQQKIIHFLALKHQPQLGSVIGKECFLTSGGTSKQMSELQNKGFVDAYRIGRDNKYELKEPMLRYCIELTDNRDGIIGLFARFITILYSDTEIINRYLKLKYLSNENCDDLHLTKKEDEVSLYAKAGEKNTQNFEHLESFIDLIKDNKTRSAMAQILIKISNTYYNCPIADEKCTCSRFLNIETKENTILKIFITELVSFSLFEEAYNLVCISKKTKETKNEESITTPIFFIKCLYEFNVNKDIKKEYLNKLLKLKLDEITKLLIVTILEASFKNNNQAVYNLTKDERALLSLVEEKGEGFVYPSEMLEINVENSDQIKAKLFDELIAKYPRSGVCHIKYAKYSASQNLINKAEKSFEKAIKLEPRNTDFKYEYATFLFKEKNEIKLALKYLKECVDINSKSMKYWSRYISILKYYDITETRKTYEKIQSLFPNSSDFFQSYGDFLYEQGENQIAIEKLNNSIELDKNNDQAYYTLGEIYAEEDNHDLAIENFTKAIEIEDSNFYVLVDRGISYFEIHEYNNALIDFENYLNNFTKEEIIIDLENSEQSAILSVFNMLLLGIITNKQKYIKLSKSYLDGATLSTEITWAYGLFAHIQEDVLNSNNYNSPRDFIKKLNKIHKTEEIVWKFTPFKNWVKLKKSRINDEKKKKYILDLFEEIELVQKKSK